MRPPRIPSIDNFERLFVEHEWSVLRIVEHFGLDPDEVRAELVDVGLELPPKGRGRTIVKQGYSREAEVEIPKAEMAREICYDEAYSLIYYGVKATDAAKKRSRAAADRAV